MRLAFISMMLGAPWGGSEELWAAAARQARADGLEVAASLPRWPSTPHQIRELEQIGVRISWRSRMELPRALARRAITEVLDSMRLSSEAAGRWVDSVVSPLNSIREFRPDMICVSQGGTYDAAFCRSLTYLLQRSGLPYVMICQLSDDAESVSDQVRQTAKELFVQAKHVIFVSDANRRTTERQLAFRLSNAMVLRNPVNLRDQRPVSWPHLAVPRFAVVARLEARYKGQDALLEALNSGSWGQREWQFTFYGDGPDRSYLEQLVEHYKLERVVNLTGYQSDVRRIWADNHILVLPSRAEGTPLALVEAALCGRPVLATDVGGNREWIEDNQTGFVAEAPTASSLATAIERAWQSRDRWEVMGARGHEYAAARVDSNPGRTLLELLTTAASKSTAPLPPQPVLPRV